MKDEELRTRFKILRLSESWHNLITLEFACFIFSAVVTQVSIFLAILLGMLGIVCFVFALIKENKVQQLAKTLPETETKTKAVY